MADLHTAQWGLNNGRRLAGNSAAFPNDDEETDDSNQINGRGLHRRDRHNGGAEDVVRQPQGDLHRR